MTDVYQDMYDFKLRPDCGKCFGLCCTALYFSSSEGFPTDKAAGIPCVNLQPDFTCSVHAELRDKGLKGCIAYDCIGAGQRVSQVTFNGNDWRQVPESAEKMSDIFVIMRQLHEMLWYLVQAINLQKDESSRQEIISIINETEHLTLSGASSLLKLDIEAHWDKVDTLLQNTSELVRSNMPKEKRGRLKTKPHRRLDYFGKDLRKAKLIGEDLRGACLIAANLSGVDLSRADLIGADLRDTDLTGADLSNSIFLTQAQINAAKGNSDTKLPFMLSYPLHWIK